MKPRREAPERWAPADATPDSFAGTKAVERAPIPPPDVRRRVLLAEDDDALRTLVASVLRGDGHEAIEFDRSDALLRYLHALRVHTPSVPAPDLLVTDLRMPGTNGLDALAALRRGGWSLPVIVMTAFGDAETHAAARRLGAAMVIDKPFHLAVLLAAVARLLEA